MEQIITGTIWARDDTVVNEIKADEHTNSEHELTSFERSKRKSREARGHLVKLRGKKLF